MKKLLLLFTVSLFLVNTAFTQEEKKNAKKDQTELPKATSKKVTAKLPESNPDLIFIEGEDAVATNFNKEPILNYSCSGYRTLQLNQTTGLQNDAEYYADFVFYVEEDGIYEFWYGGTPPGLKNELLSSYSSPFQYVLDGITTKDVYREDTHVVESYAPAYYWNYVSDITLQKGQHRISIKVKQRRTYDNRFYFNMDNFFFIRKNNNKRAVISKKPAVFPNDMDNRSIDNPFKPIEEYEIAIRDNPEQINNYVEISLIYSLIGDYLNALKYLRRASYIEPGDPEIMLLIAKNTIWRGDFYTGLDLYRELLDYYPEKINLATEAGKIAAWTGLYDESTKFFTKALKTAPKDINLLVNLGMTYQWSGDKNKAEINFNKAKKIIGNSTKGYKALAKIYEVNEDAEYAAKLYTEAINIDPADIELYLLLEDIYRRLGEKDKILKIRDVVKDSFVSTPELANLLKTFYEKQSMKDQVVLEYEKQLINEPDNLQLRSQLAELYFWNGFRKEAIKEYLNILTTKTYKNIQDTESKTLSFFEIMDRNYAYLNYLNKIPFFIATSQKELSTQYNIYNQAKKNLASQKSKKEPVDEKIILDLESKVNNEELKLASMIAAKQTFIDKFKTLVNQYNSEKELFERLKEAEKSNDETFKNITEGTNWKWDRKALLDELDIVKRNRMKLAPYILGRIALFEGDADSAASNYSDIINNKPGIPGTPFGMFQAELWKGNDKEYKKLAEKYYEEISEKASYFPDLMEYINYLEEKDDDAIGFLTKEASEEILSLNKTFSTLKEDSLILKEKVNNNISDVSQVLFRKMERSFFDLSLDTYLLRNQLGDFYQQEKLYSEAITQYKQVLAIDPWNIAATFKLGQGHQHNGNWHKALELYEDVYWQDPLYGNVTSFYNEVAKEHADTFTFSGESVSDNEDFTYTTRAEYLTQINGKYSLGINYATQYKRDFAGTGSSETGSYFLHNPSINVPIYFAGIKTTLKPFIGGIINSEYIDEESSTTTVSESDYRSSIDSYLMGGADLSINVKPVYLSAQYEYNWEEDTFLPNREKISYLKATANIYSTFLKAKDFRESSIRLSGYKKDFDDSNSAYGGFFDLMINYDVMPNPELSFQLIGSASYEDSSDFKTQYWTPHKVISISGGFGGNISLPVGKNKNISEALRFSAGPYQEDDSAGTTIKSTNFELENNFSYNTDNFSFYLKVLGTAKNRTSPTSKSFDYWSMTVDLGVTAKMPSLLVP